MNKLSVLTITLLMATSVAAQRLEPPKVEIFGFEVVEHNQHADAGGHDHANVAHHDNANHHAHDHNNNHGHGHEHSHADSHGHDDDHGHKHAAHNADIPGFRIGVFIRNPNGININPTTMDYRITFENNFTISGTRVIEEPIPALVKAEYDFVFVPTDHAMAEQLREYMSHHNDDVEYHLDVAVGFKTYRQKYTAKDGGSVNLHNYH